jgi:RES domain-containing protein
VPVEAAALAVRGRWLRHTPPGTPPLPKREPPPDNRWQRGEVVDALYLADTEDTVWAEWYRHLAERAIPPLAQMPRDLWSWNVDVEVADLTTSDRIAAAGLSPPTPGRAGWAPYQTVGEQLWRDGWAGLIAPSSARPAGRLLCLFRSGDAVAGAKPVPPPRQVSEPPAPPAGLRT